jgi:hypothetical protein
MMVNKTHQKTDRSRYLSTHSGYQLIGNPAKRLTDKIVRVKHAKQFSVE